MRIQHFSLPRTWGRQDDEKFCFKLKKKGNKAA